MAVSEAAATSAAVVLERLNSAAARAHLHRGGSPARSCVGPNAVRTHRAQPLAILGRQLRSAVLILLAVTAFISFFLGQRTDTVVIGVILLASVGLGFVNEYRAERATEALHSQVTHTAVVAARRRGPSRSTSPRWSPATSCALALGEVVPADLRLLTPPAWSATRASSPASPSPPPRPVAPVRGRLGPRRPHLRARSWAPWFAPAPAPGVVVATGARAEFGRSPPGSGSASPRPTSRSGCGTSRSCCCRSRSR